MFEKITEQVINGEINPLKAYIDLKRYESELKNAMAIVGPLATSEADKYAEKTINAFGAIVEKRSAPSTWNYETVNAYQSAKARLEYIQKIAQAGGGADADTGEIIDKAVKIPGKAIIAVNLKK